MTYTRIILTMLSCFIILITGGCGRPEEFDPAALVPLIASSAQALGATYLKVRISPDNGLGYYLSGTKLTISWELIGPAHTGAFTLEQGGRVLATSLWPNSFTWTVPDVAAVENYWFELKLWDGEPGKSSYNIFTKGVFAQPKPWTSGKLSVMAPSLGERVPGNSVYRVKWDFLRGPWVSAPNDYSAYLCIWDGIGYNYQSLSYTRMIDLASFTMYYDMKMPAVSGATPAYIHFISREFNSAALRDETKRYFFIEECSFGHFLSRAASELPT
jgi:hypothetical protein